ncbi:MAG TPA: ABC transporter ATP-binding protein [Bacteroidales bacterium]|nr:ABC transporter ATP-binding protein [Bacteroidales bacterium]
MKRFNKILRYLVPYWAKAALNVLFNFLSVVFSLFSLTMVIPFLGILFGTQPTVDELYPFSLGFMREEGLSLFAMLKNNFYFYISQLIQNRSEIYALIFVSGLVIIMSLLKTGFKYLAMYNLATIRNGVVKDMRDSLYAKSVGLPLSYYSNERKGDIISRMTNDVHIVEWSIISSLEMLFSDPITIIVYLAGLIIISPHLTLFVLILLPISALIIGRLGKTLKTTALKGQKKMGLILSIMDETLGGLRVIKAFNSEERVKKRFFSVNNFYTRIMIKMYRRQYLATPLSEFLGTAVVVFIMWYGGSLVLGAQTTLSPENFIGYLVIFSQIINPAKSFSTAWYNVQKGMASAERIEEVLNAKIQIVEKPDARPVETFNNCIEYRKVGFKYESKWVLKDIDLKIEKGKTVALVGQSGAGKSTLVDLLPRFYDAVEGEILLDGVPVKDCRIKDLRNLMGIVNQEAILFNDTFANNIAFGSDGATQEEIEQAAKVANAHEFIMNSKNGYYTNIGDRGGKLSGGQRQRISIARAVLKNPPILILDEATSSLDTESERLVQDAITNLMRNRTSIVIAHRLSTVVNADLICVMHEGRIVEKGTHAQLMKENGIYSRLHSIQMFS